MKAYSFHLPTDLPGFLADCSGNGEVTRLSFDGNNELFFTEVMTDSYSECYRMFRFGARFLTNGHLTGLALGVVFQVRRGWTAPDSETFYDWCDSTDEQITELARWICDSGHYDELFDNGDVLAVDAFEFLPEIEASTQRSAMRVMTTALKRRFRQLGRAVVVVHPCQYGEPPGLNGSTRRVNSYRKAVEKVLKMAIELDLSTRLRPKSPMDDLLITRDPSIDPYRELLELGNRTGIFRQVMEDAQGSNARTS